MSLDISFGQIKYLLFKFEWTSPIMSKMAPTVCPPNTFLEVLKSNSKKSQILFFFLPNSKKFHCFFRKGIKARIGSVKLSLILLLKRVITNFYSCKGHCISDYRLFPYNNSNNMMSHIHIIHRGNRAENLCQK